MHYKEEKKIEQFFTVKFINNKKQNKKRTTNRKKNIVFLY